MSIRARISPVLPISLAFILILGRSASRGAETAAAPEITGKFETASGIPVLSLWGSPKERGFAQGWLLAEEILTMAQEGLAPIIGQDQAALTRLAPLVASGFSFSADETAELEGLAEGIAKRMPGRKVPLLDRQLTVADLKLINTYGDWYALGCSSAALWGKLTADGKPAVVRNFDFMALPYITRYQHVRVVAAEPSKKTRGWVGVGLPASLGPVTAMNSEGVFVAIHDVYVKPVMKDYLQGNVPRLVAVRRLLEQLPAHGAVEKSAELCRTWNTLFGNNFMVATPDASAGLAAGILEYDTREDKEHGVTLRGPAAGEGGKTLEYVACSNGHRARGQDTCHRYDSLINGCRDKQGGPFDRAALEDLVGRAAVPAGGKPVGDSGIATLHEAVGITGERKLWIRFLPSREKNIVDARTCEFAVDALLAGLPKSVTARAN